MIKIFNRILWGIKPPENNSDIWFDGEVFKIYRKGEWEAITIEIDAAAKLADIIKDVDNVYQTKLSAGDGIILEDSKISTNKIFQVVGELPETGDFNTVYLLTLNDTTIGSYVYVDNEWMSLVSTIEIDKNLNIYSTNPVENKAVTKKIESLDVVRIIDGGVNGLESGNFRDGSVGSAISSDHAFSGVTLTREHIGCTIQGVKWIYNGGLILFPNFGVNTSCTINLRNNYGDIGSIKMYYKNFTSLDIDIILPNEHITLMKDSNVFLPENVNTVLTNKLSYYQIVGIYNNGFDVDSFAPYFQFDLTRDIRALYFKNGDWKKVLIEDNVKTINGHSILGEGNIEINTSKSLVFDVDNIEPIYSIEGSKFFSLEQLESNIGSTIDEILEFSRNDMIDFRCDGMLFKSNCGSTYDENTDTIILLYGTPGLENYYILSIFKEPVEVDSGIYASATLSAVPLPQNEDNDSTGGGIYEIKYDYLNGTPLSGEDIAFNKEVFDRLNNNEVSALYVTIIIDNNPTHIVADSFLYAQIPLGETYISSVYLNFNSDSLLVFGLSKKTVGILSTGQCVEMPISSNIVDDEMSETSENAVQNKVITKELNNKVDKVSGKQLSTEDFTTNDKQKLDGLSNYDDSEIKANLEQAGKLAYDAFMVASRNEQDKVSKEEGKGLSTNDYTDEDKSKLEGLDNYDDSEVKQSIAEVRESIANINPAPMVSVTYSELVELRNNGGLIAGMQYRITDYVTTTAQENTRSAGHPFDVIATADSNNALNEVARACLHEGDDYFLNEAPKLEAWKIWYCLDNDAERFAWADAENGKGVIYRMIDEWNNDLPYDFKNIMFKRYELNAPELYEASGDDYWIQKLLESIRAMFNSECYAFIWSGLYEQDKYWENDYEAIMSTPTGRSRFFYTFSDDSDIPNDSSLGGPCCDNVMLSSYRLPNNVFFGGGEHYGNRFGSNCYDNSFSFECLHNTFGSDCCENCFGVSCSYNTFGNDSSHNSLGDECQYNNFGNQFNYNSLGDECINNSFGNASEYNGLGMGSSYNAFGNECSYNGFGIYCQYNRLGNFCQYNSAGDYFLYNSFGEYCQNNIFKDASGMAHKVMQNTFENGVSSVEFYFDDTPDTYANLRWHHVYSGVENCQIELYDSRRYETCYACDQQGNVHTFCIMDFKNS